MLSFGSYFFNSFHDFHACLSFHAGQNLVSAVETVIAQTCYFTGCEFWSFHGVEKVETVFFRVSTPRNPSISAL